MAERNKEIIFSYNDVGYNDYKSKLARNNMDAKSDYIIRRMIFSSYDNYKNDEKKDIYKYKTNKIKKRNKSLYRKIIIKSKISNYINDSNTNLLNGNIPEENHFKIISFLQKMKTNNY